MVYESALDLPAWADVQDEEIVDRVRAGETVFYEIHASAQPALVSWRQRFCGTTRGLRT
jgi:hypothetical protein